MLRFLHLLGPGKPPNLPGIQVRFPVGETIVDGGELLRRRGRRTPRIQKLVVDIKADVADVASTAAVHYLVGWGQRYRALVLVLVEPQLGVMAMQAQVDSASRSS